MFLCKYEAIIISNYAIMPIRNRNISSSIIFKLWKQKIITKLVKFATIGKE